MKLNQYVPVKYSRIYSLGAARGDLVVTNDEVAGPIDSSDEWIRQRTGIITRRRASRTLSLMDMAVAASNEAIEKAGISPAEIGAVIVSTITHPHQTPSAAALLAEKIGANPAPAYDISAACAGYCYGIAQADALVKRLLALWPAMSACQDMPPVAEVQPLKAAQAVSLPFDSAQAHVLMGQPGYKRNDPDFFALLVGNHILGGGGFVSRLTEQVREKRGLSYSVYSYFAAGMHAGAFTVGLQTRPDQAAQAVQVSRDVIARFVAEGPTEAELRAAKDNLIGGFALRIDSNKKLLGNVANIAWNDLPLNYLDTWAQQVEKISVDDIRRAYARVLQPDRMVTVVVGARP